MRVNLPTDLDVAVTDVSLNGEVIGTVAVTDVARDELLATASGVAIDVEASRREAAQTLYDKLRAAGFDLPGIKGQINVILADEAARLRKGEAAATAPRRMTMGELVKDYPQLKPPLIDGMLRREETATVVAPPKIGKTWLIDQLALAIKAGVPWLGHTTHAGKVLLVDNELHLETLADRLPRVAEAMGVACQCDDLEVISLRGRLLDLEQLERDVFSKLGRGEFAAIILDSLYRLQPRDSDENSNSDTTQFYNRIDGIARLTGSAIIGVHHTSKGSQADKSPTDVGSGGGAQARAVDLYLILRHHETPGAVVAEWVNRSWAPAAPVCLRREFPLWEVAPDLDPTKLLRPRPRGGRPPKGSDLKQQIAAAAADASPPDPHPWKAFAARFVTEAPKTKAVILSEADSAGITGRQALQLLNAAADTGTVHRWKQGPKEPDLYSTIPNPSLLPLSFPPAAEKPPKQRRGRKL